MHGDRMGILNGAYTALKNIRWRSISRALLFLGILGLLYTALLSCVQMIAMYAPPGIAAANNARKGQDLFLIVASLAVIFGAAAVTCFAGLRQEKAAEPGQKEDRGP